MIVLLGVLIFVCGFTIGVIATLELIEYELAED